MSIAFPKPDEGVLAHRNEILAGLAQLVAPEALVTSEDERRAFETDALTAYRKMPLAVVLPSTTQEVSAVLKFCHQHGVKVVPRGAGTSLAGGAIAQEDAIILGVAKMNRILETDFESRTARVQSGVTNLAISQAVSPEGFFYAPDPSSQLACTLAGNIAMNSGGAHCLKYGVTTNNLLGVTLVLLDGTVVEIGGKHLDSPGYDLLGLVCGSEGELGVVTEAPVRILRAAEGARPALMGFDSAETAGACVAAIIGAGIIPVAMEYMDRLAIEISEAFAHAGYPLDVEAMLIIEVEGSDAEIEDMLNRIVEIAKRGRSVRGRGRRDLEGPQGNRRSLGPRLRFYRHGWHDPHRPTPFCAPSHPRDLSWLRPQGGHCPPCWRREPAPEYHVRHQQAGRAGEGRSGRRGHSQTLRRGWRLPHGRARGRHREARPDDGPVRPGGPSAADARAGRVRSGVAPQPGQGLPAGRQIPSRLAQA